MDEIEIRIAEAKMKLISTINQLVKEYQIPAFLFVGIMAEVMNDIKDQDKGDVVNAYRRKIADLEKELHELKDPEVEVFNALGEE